MSANNRLHDCILQFHEDIFNAEAASTFVLLLRMSRVLLHMGTTMVGFSADDLQRQLTVTENSAK